MKFSIAIPVRNGSPTIESTLHSCINQLSFTDYEIVVFNNCSDDQTCAVIDTFSSDRLRVANSKRPLCMADSWESCIELCKGDYVIVLGADDGILPSTLGVLDKLTTIHPNIPIRWTPAYYHWPSSPFVNKRSRLIIPLGATAELTPTRSLVSRVGRLQSAYESLPMLYNTCISRSALESIRLRAGRVLLAANPDIASGLAIASSHRSFLSIRLPLTIAAGSGKSNGAASSVAQQANDGNTATFQDFTSLNELAGFGIHPELPSLNLLCLHIADAYIRVREGLEPSLPSLNRRKLLEACKIEIDLKVAEPLRANYIAVIESHFKTRIHANSNTSMRPVSPLDQPTKFTTGFDERRKALVVDVEQFDCSDINSVCELCERLISLPSTAMRLQFRRSASLPLRVKGAIKALFDYKSDDSWF